jgi:hypothetical protein
MTMPGAIGMGGTTFATKPVPKKATPTRYEFSIIFVWQEWTPSDALMPKPEATTTEGAPGR